MTPHFRTTIDRSMEKPSSKHEFTETKALQNEAATIHRLPIEILLQIISLSAPRPSISTPYPCILFSGVCRYWRSIILCNATFWTTIVLDKRINLAFLQEFIERSQTAPLELIVVSSQLSLYIFRDSLELLRKEVVTRNRVNTVHIVNSTASLYNLYIATLASLFPFAENIFCNYFVAVGSYDPSLPSLGVQPRLKTLRISIARLGCLKIPGQFPGLRWLQLKYDHLIPVSSLLEALENLPNLQVLYLPSPEWIDLIAPRSTDCIITLYELRCLITEGSIPQFIRAPKLTYLDVKNYPRSCGNVPFCGFDFSRITQMIFNVDRSGYFSITGSNQRKDSEATFSLYREFKSILDPIPDSYPNAFRIALEGTVPQDPTSAGPRTFLPFLTACVNQITNLTAVFFLCKYRLRRRWTRIELNAFFTNLQGATSVRRLVVTGGCSFPTLCDLLSDANIFPSLTAIAYFNDGERPQNFSDLHSLRSLQGLMKGRSGMGPRPLQIELGGFPPLRSELTEQIEDLGIRFIQSNRNRFTMRAGTGELAVI